MIAVLISEIKIMNICKNISFFIIFYENIIDFS